MSAPKFTQLANQQTGNPASETGHVNRLDMGPRKCPCGSCPGGGGSGGSSCENCGAFRYVIAAILGATSLALLFALVMGTTKNHVTPPPPPSTPPLVTFLSFGDWGFQSPDQFAVAKQMGIVANNTQASFLLSLGDNFYPEGVANDTDPLWKSLYSDVYTAPSLKFPWLISLGNHDHYAPNGNEGQAQIDYWKNSRDSRWTLKDFWYTMNYQFGNSTLQFVIYDSYIAVGDVNSTAWVLEKKQQQSEWLLKTLYESKADWLFLVGHHPIYSFHFDTPTLVKDLVPMIKDTRVDIFFAGHDHDLQHLESDSCQYIVSGAGAKATEDKPTNPSSNGKWSMQTNGFTVHQLWDNTLITKFIDREGKEIHSVTQQRRVKQSPAEKFAKRPPKTLAEEYATVFQPIA